MKLSMDALHTLNLMLENKSAPFGLNVPTKPLEEVIQSGKEYLEENEYTKDNILTEKGEIASVILTLLVNANDFVKMEHTMIALDADMSKLRMCGYQILENHEVFLVEGVRIGFVANILKDSEFIISTDPKSNLDESWHEVNMVTFMLESRKKSGLHFEIYKNRNMTDNRYLLQMDEIVEVDVLGKKVRAITPLNARKNIMEWLEVTDDETRITY